MTFGAFAMMFRERQMISKIRTHLEIGFDSVCYDVLPNRHCKPKRHRKPSQTLTTEHDPGGAISEKLIKMSKNYGGGGLRYRQN